MKALELAAKGAGGNVRELDLVQIGLNLRPIIDRRAGVTCGGPTERESGRTPFGWQKSVAYGRKVAAEPAHHPVGKCPKKAEKSQCRIGWESGCGMVIHQVMAYGRTCVDIKLGVAI